MVLCWLFLFYKENKDLSDWFYLGFGLIVFAVLFHMWRLLKPGRAYLPGLNKATRQQ